MEMDCIHKNDGIITILRSVLPFSGNRQDPVCHVGNHLGWSIYTIYIAKKCRDVPRCHTFYIHGQYLVFDIRDICLIFLRPGVQTLLSVPWYIQINSSRGRCDCPRAITVLSVICILTLVVILGVSLHIIIYRFFHGLPTYYSHAFSYRHRFLSYVQLLKIVKLPEEILMCCK